MSAHVDTLPAPPEKVGLPSLVTGIAGGGALAGAGALGWTFISGDLEIAWSTYLIGAFFALGLGVFGLAWIAIVNLAGGTWAVTMRRVPEAMTAWLLPGGVLALAVLAGAGTLYHWSSIEAVQADELLTHKAPFLNMRMFATFGVVTILLWVAFAALIVGASRRQDTEGGVRASYSNRAMSALFLVIFALSFSVLSFYFLLSLDAHWFSTMFAVLVFTDVSQSGTAFITLVAALLVSSGAMKGFLNDNHLHSIGKMLFAWTGFWAYIYFCQFMLIWYANLPEETVYYLRRIDNGWLPYMVALPLLKFAVPFLLMLPREAKRSPGRLIPVAALVLFAQFWELYLMVGPAVGHGAAAAHAHLPVIELLGTLGFIGLFMLVFNWALQRHSPIPLKDPGLAECLHYHS